jgi:hypothetical protein
MCDSLSTKQKQELAGLAAGWQARLARWTEARLLASSSEVSDENQTMEEASDDEPTPRPRKSSRSRMCQRSSTSTIS